MSQKHPNPLAPQDELSRWLSRRPAALRRLVKSRANALDSAVSPKSSAARSKARATGKFPPSSDKFLNAAGKYVPFRRKPARWRAPGTFADLCEASEGRAVVWRRNGCTDREMWTFVHNDPLILDSVVPALHARGLSEADVLEFVPRFGPLQLLIADFLVGLTKPQNNPLRSADLSCVAPLWTLLAVMRKLATKRITRLQSRLMRPAYYEAERDRRRRLAAERRRIRRRSTTNPCPTPKALVEVWAHARDTKESLMYFGSMVNDLECHVDSSLRFSQDGRIVGRNGGVKFWLQTHAPELYAHYTTVMRYGSAAKKLKQIVGLSDPTPAAAVLDGRARGSADVGRGKADMGERGRTQSRCGGKIGGGGEGGASGAAQLRCGGKILEAAREMWLEAMDGVPDVAAHVLDRIDSLLDPETIEDATMLKAWKERYGPWQHMPGEDTPPDRQSHERRRTG